MMAGNRPAASVMCKSAASVTPSDIGMRTLRTSVTGNSTSNSAREYHRGQGTPRGWRFYHNESHVDSGRINRVRNVLGGVAMPLLDHFHPPLAPRRHWESFHVNWAGAMADALNDQLLPDGYFAEEHAQLGARVEIDVATFAESDRGASPPRDGATATIPVRVWTPPAPALVIPAAFPDSFEVLVFQSEGGTRLVGAIELVSPANKDRDSHRQAFVIKCASYLCQGISLAIVDIVTSRQANLHN